MNHAKPKIKATFPTNRCERCGWKWQPRKAVVVECPACKSRAWKVK